MKTTALLTFVLLPTAWLVAQSAAPRNSNPTSPRFTQTAPPEPGQSLATMFGGSYSGEGAAAPAATQPGTMARGFYNALATTVPRVSPKEQELNRQISAATRDLRSPDEGKRLTAEETLQTSLEQLFDERTTTREQQISDLENRLQKLRDQLEARKQKKAEIVRLRLQTLINEANGLSL